MANHINGTGTSIPGNGTGTSIPGNGTGTSIPGNGTGTSIPGNGTGTAIPNNGTGTAVPDGGTGTMATGGNPSDRMGSTADIPLLAEYVINGIRYKVNQEKSSVTLSRMSGEARIMVVENGGRLFALKIYIPNHGPDHRVLDKVQRAKGGFIVKLHDHGRWTDPSTGRTFDYEIMDYLAYGSLSEVNLRYDEQLFANVAMRMAFAIRQSHEQGVVHRDVKPENFMFTDADKRDFVLIDFGIARETDGVNPIKVDAAKSSYFVSPEGAISSNDRTTYVGPATDYYSMGMSLLAMLYGETNFYNMYPVNDLGRLDLQKRRNIVVAEARRNGLKMSDRTAELLEALLEFSDSQRAGFVEVERWFKGEHIRRRDTNDTQRFRVVFNDARNLVANSPEELASMLLSDMEFARKFLYRGIAKSALQGIRPTLALEIEDITQTVYPKADEQEAGVYAAALMLDPSIKYRTVSGKEIDSIEAIAHEVWENRTLYATRLGDKTDRLWIYLQANGDEKIKSLMTRYQPVIKKSGIHGLYAFVRALNPKLTYYIDDKTGVKITDEGALARELWKNRDRYATELRDSNHSVYTWLKGRGWTDKNIKDTVELDIIPHGVNGVYTLVMMLDIDFPLYDHNGKAMTALDEVSNEILNYYISHSDELLDNSHPLWTWLGVKGDAIEKIVKSTVNKLEKGNSTPIWELYYKIGTGRKPFVIQRHDDKKYYYEYSLNEVIEDIRLFGLTESSWKDISTHLFALWLTVNESADDTRLGALLEDLIKKGGGGTVLKSYEYLYRMRPDISMNFYTDKKNDFYIGTAAQLGKALEEEFDPGQRVTYFKNTLAGNMMGMLKDVGTFRNSLMYVYMKTRNMDSYIKSIEQWLDIPANIKAHPSAPYDWDTAIWKIIATLGCEPYYTFKDSGNDNGVAKSAADVGRRSQATLLKQEKSDLFPFLSLFFHENIKSSFSFEKLQSFYNFIRQHISSSDVARQGIQAEHEVYDSIVKRDKAWRSLNRIRKISLWICMPVMLAITGVICYLIATDGAATVSAALDSISIYIKWTLAIVGAVLGLMEGLAGAVGGGIVGWLIGWLLMWLLSAVAAYLLVAVLLGAAVWAAWKIISSTTDTYIPNKTKYDQMVKQADIYVVTKALGTYNRVFAGNGDHPSHVFEKSYDLAVKYKKGARNALITMIITTIVTIVLGVMIIHGTDAVVEKMANDIPGFEYVQGSYSGTFHERNAVMVLEADDALSTTAGNLHGTVTINYSTPLVQKVSGNYTDGKLQLFVIENGAVNNKIKYSGAFTINEQDYEATIAGTYTNRVKGTTHSFVFTRIAEDYAGESDAYEQPATQSSSQPKQNAAQHPAPVVEVVETPVEENVPEQGQRAGNKPAESNTPLSFDDLDVKPSFPGGQSELSRWFKEHLTYPAEAIEAGVTGRVLVGFLVDKSGKISDVHIIESVHPALDDEAMRVVKAMPTWEPGQVNGEPVNVRYNIPVVFKL